MKVLLRKALTGALVGAALCSLTVLPGTPAHAADPADTATPALIEGESDFAELGRSLGQIRLRAAAGAGVPETPVFGPSIDDYAVSDQQDTCDPSEKPGPVALRALLNETYDYHRTGNIGRECSADGRSEHKEGRALDYMLDYNNVHQRDVAETVLDWMLDTDSHGNKHAVARRLGIMYLIWNHRIWSSARASEGWRAYSGENPHTDHIHFSFGWPGARKQTSWWNAAVPQPTAHNQPVPVYEDDSTQTQLFGRGKDGLLINSYRQTDGAWAAWKTIGTWKMAGDPSPVYQPNLGVTEVFARGTDDKLIHVYQTATGWSSWGVIGDWKLGSDPVAIYQPNTKVTEVFARGADGKLIHVYRGEDLKWSAWDAIGDWKFTGEPAPIYQPNLGVTEVFARGNDSRLIHVYRNKDLSWSNWSVLGDWRLGSEPSAVYQPDVKTLEVFARGGDGKLIHIYRGEDLKWSAWDAIGDWEMAGKPAALYQPSIGVTEVFARGTDGLLIHVYRNEDLSWSDWGALGGWKLSSDPTVVYQPSTRFTEVFGRGTDGLVDHVWRKPDLTWAPWDALGTWQLG